MKYLHKWNLKFINKLKWLSISSFFILLLILAFLYQDLFTNNIITSLKLWLLKIVPSISTIYLISLVLINYPVISKILYKPLKKILHFENEVSCSIFLISILSGNPTTAKLITKKVNSNEISITEGNRLLGFTSFLSPLFLYVMLPKSIFLITFVIQLSSSLFIGMYKDKNKLDNSKKSINNKSFLDIINDCINTLPEILLGIISSMVIISIISIPITLFNSYLASFFEVSNGIVTLLNIKNEILLLVLINLLVSLSGIAIVLQVYLTLKKTHLSFKHYLLMRLFHQLICLIELCVYFIILFIFKFLF